MDDVHARELLSRERARIERAIGQLRNTGNGDVSHVHQHLAEGASDLFDSERDESLHSSLCAELEAVRRAEQRLASGAFGMSIDSGLAIPDARLEIVPWAERTVEEQSRLNRR